MPDRNHHSPAQIHRRLIPEHELEPTCRQLFGPRWQADFRPAIVHETHRCIDGYREGAWLHYTIEGASWDGPGFYMAPMIQSTVFVRCPGDFWSGYFSADAVGVVA